MRLSVVAKSVSLTVILFVFALHAAPALAVISNCSSDVFNIFFDDSLGYALISGAHQATITDLAFDCSRQILLSVADDGFIRIWSLESGAMLREIDGAGGEIWNIDIQPTGPCFATSHQDGTVKLWNLDTGELMNSWQAHAEAVYYVFWKSDEVLRTGSCVEANQYCELGQTRMWNVSGELLGSENLSKGWAWWGQAAPDHSTWASTSCADRDGSSYCLKGEILIWDTATGERMRLATDSDAIIYGDYSPDGKTLVVSTFFGIRQDTSPQIMLYDVQTGKQLWRREFAHFYSINMVKFHQNGNLIASASFDGTLKLWTSAGAEIQTYRVDAGNVRSIKFHPQSNLLFVGTCLEITSAGCTQGDILIYDINEFVD